MDTGDYHEESFIDNKSTTFLMKVHSGVMLSAGIHSGDTVIIDRSVKVESGKIVIAALNGEILIRRFERTFNKIRLVPGSPALSPIDIDPSCEGFSIWGVVTYVIHSLP